MIVLDTSVLIDSLAGSPQPAATLRHTIAEGERVVLTTLVLYEWLRGPRRPEELSAQEALFPRNSAIPFGQAEAECAAALYGKVRSARSREMDLAIAACAICWDAQLWTLNRKDFADIPGLELYRPQP